MKSVYNSITASMGLCIALISGGWIVNGCESCFVFGLLGIFLGGFFFWYGIDHIEMPKIDWRKARRNLSMPTKMWDDKRWVVGYWIQFVLMETYMLIGVALYISGLITIVRGFPFVGLVVGIVGTGFIYVFLIQYKNLCKFVENELPKFKRGRR